MVRLAESGQHDGRSDGDEEPYPGDGGQSRPGLVAEENNPDDGGRDRLGQHHGGRGDRHAAALQGGGVEHERDNAGRGDRVGGRVAGELERREAVQHAGGDAEHPEAETGREAERGGAVRVVELGRGHAHHGQAGYRHDQGELEHRSHVGGSLGAGRGAEQAHAGHHADDRRPLPPGQGHADHARGDDRRHREVRRDEGLHDEQGKPLQGHQLGHEAEHVKADADHKPPLVQHAHHETRIDAASRDVLEPSMAGRTYGNRLHHRSNTVEDRRDDRRDQAD